MVSALTQATMMIGTLRRPSEEELDVLFKAKAKEEEWMQGDKMCGGRPRGDVDTRDPDD